MKKTISALLAVVAVMAMMLSMTVSAAATRIYVLPGEEIEGETIGLQTVGCMNTDLEDNGDGSYTQIMNVESAGGSVGSYIAIADPAIIDAYPYLVLEVLENNGVSWAFYGWDEDQIATRPFTPGFVTDTGKFVANLKTGEGIVTTEDKVGDDQTFTCQIWIAGAADADWTVKLYLTDDPDADAAQGGDKPAGAETAVAVAATAVLGAGALLFVSRKK